MEESTLNGKLDSIRQSFSFFVPELILIGGILLLIVGGLVKRKTDRSLHVISFLIFSLTLISILSGWRSISTETIFLDMLQRDHFSEYFKILFNASALLTVLLTVLKQNKQSRLAEYYALLAAIVLGAHLLVMSANFIIIFISLELISISSYVLTSFSFDKKSTEGSLKYFIFGSVASAVMLYGFSLLYGLTGSLTFSSVDFATQLSANTPLLFIGVTMILAGFLFKIAAAPLHIWSPDVYEAAPMPVVAFFSVVPKLAGLGILAKFILLVSVDAFSVQTWQPILAIIAGLTLTIGNFSALAQKNPKRLMAYSSIAQSAFLLIGVIAWTSQGLQFMLFYAAVYVLMNFLIFNYLQYFEEKGFTTIASYADTGKRFLLPLVCMLVGFISLTGLPPTSGFTAKLFIFSSLWEAYQLSQKSYLLWLLIFALLNTVVALFYYIRIPYYSLIRAKESIEKTHNNLTPENLLGLILVLLVLILFFSPGLLMGWINKINFVH